MDIIRKRGQISIFIIVAIIIIVIAVILFFILRENRFIERIIGKSIDEEKFMKDCIKDNKEISRALKVIANSGGVLEPKNFMYYKGEKIEYLCYIDGYLKTCYIQKPFLLKSITEELSKIVEVEVRKCGNSLKEELEARGYQVNIGEVKSEISIVPKSVIFNIEYPITITKENSRTIKNFEVRKSSNLYTMSMIASSIINYESRYGESEIMIYNILYPNIKVEKKKMGDGSTVYILTDRNSKETLRFAVRSLVFPIGYSLEGERK